ncbi:hypothetical protein PQR02_11845 [Paraburkholderia sediminicola]|uniref:Uncharacterized protein n=1 Tax=Paraburkholderia rhynchosiae TaxID=487049 RepID=A0ACC7N7N7_9BURK
MRRRKATRPAWRPESEAVESVSCWFLPLDAKPEAAPFLLERSSGKNPSLQFAFEENAWKYALRDSENRLAE